MIDPKHIEQAANVSIVEYLASKGIEPVKAVGKELVYLSPLRNEQSPSFYVSPTKNRFIDFTNEEHRGNALALVQLLEGCSFPQAVERLLAFGGQPVNDKPRLFLSATETPKELKVQATISALQHPALINYTKERGIPFSIASYYLKEVLTTAKEKTYFTVGFRNDSNGYALRNKFFKGCQGTQDITTFDLPSRKTVAVFEGFFDFLSAMVYFGRQSPKMPTVILNSTSNRGRAIAYLKQFEEVNCFFDRDPSGIDCLRLLRDNDRLTVNDCSNIYEGYKDFNEFLLSKP